MPLLTSIELNRTHFWDRCYWRRPVVLLVFGPAPSNFRVQGNLWKGKIKPLLCGMICVAVNALLNWEMYLYATCILCKRCAWAKNASHLLRQYSMSMQLFTHSTHHIHSSLRASQWQAYNDDWVMLWMTLTWIARSDNECLYGAKNKQKKRQLKYRNLEKLDQCI